MGGNNTMTHDEMIEVLTHHKNGGKVEYKRKDEARWKQVTTKIGPAWDFDLCDYRAKPEPKVIYADFHDNGCLAFCDHVKYTPPFGRKLRKFVEVEE
jgi:hypothetical protein